VTGKIKDGRKARRDETQRAIDQKVFHHRDTENTKKEKSKDFHKGTTKDILGSSVAPW